MEDITSGPAYGFTGGAKLIYQGSNFGSGAGGSGWLVNFGAEGEGIPIYSGASMGSQSRQAVIGVTSLGQSDYAKKSSWASRFGKNKEYKKTAIRRLIAKCLVKEILALQMVFVK